MVKAFQYTPEMEKFLYDHFAAFNDKVMAEKFNKEFGTELSWHQVRHFRRKHNINGVHHMQHSAIFTEEIRAYIEANYVGTGYHEMALQIFHKFGILYEDSQIRGYYRNHKLNSGLKGKLFEKGQRPQNGCRKWHCFPGSEKGWFERGKKPPNYVPVGTEKVRPSNGYVWVKIAEPKKWRMKQLLVWEEAHGPIPEGYKVYFKDGDRQNCELDNLMLIEQRVLGSLNRQGLSKFRGELADTAVNVARLSVAANDAKRRKRSEEE